jgi:DNA-binding protein HU-beta
MRGRYIVTKADLVNAIAEKSGLSKTDAEKALKAFTDAVTEALKAGEKVALVGFGTFSIGERAARIGKNPQTGAKIEIPAAKTPKFKAGKALKDSVS